METIYREMLSVALEQLHEKQDEKVTLFLLVMLVQQLQDELRRYTAERVTDDDAGTETLPNRPA